MKYRQFVWLVFFIFAGCALPEKQLPPELMYQEPLATNQTATLVGSIREEWLFDEYAFVTDINGKRVKNANENPNKEIVIHEGRNVVALAFNTSTMVATTRIEFEAVRGHAYKVGFLSDVVADYCDFWIVDIQTGKAVSDVARGYIPKNTPTYVPMPIYIPYRY